ncbi:hypothetical protein ACQY0O_001229 [Thecaphora frezii]
MPTSTRPAKRARAAEDPPEAHHAALPKALRQLLRHLFSQHALLCTESHLLARLWYKGRSQFRTAAWWKHIDGVRRCLLCLLGRAAAPGRLHTTSDALLVALSSLFSPGSSPASTQPIAMAEGEVQPPRSVPKFSTPPIRLDRTGERAPPRDVFYVAANETYTLATLLNELRKRARKAYTVAALHLRTPPAPTFAPQAVVLLTLAASVERIATDILQGSETEPGTRNSLGLNKLFRVLADVVEQQHQQHGQAEGEERDVKRRRRALMPAQPTTIAHADADDAAAHPCSTAPKPKQRPSKRRRNQLRKARLALPSPPERTPASLKPLPCAIPDPFADRPQRPRKSAKGTTKAPPSFEEASRAFDPDAVAERASRFFATPNAIAAVSLGTVSNRIGDDDDDIGEAISR